MACVCICACVCLSCTLSCVLYRDLVTHAYNSTMSILLFPDQQQITRAQCVAMCPPVIFSGSPHRPIFTQLTGSFQAYKKLSYIHIVYTHMHLCRYPQISAYTPHDIFTHIRLHIISLNRCVSIAVYSPYILNT